MCTPEYALNDIISESGFMYNTDAEEFKSFKEKFTTLDQVKEFMTKLAVVDRSAMEARLVREEELGEEVHYSELEDKGKDIFIEHFFPFIGTELNVAYDEDSFLDYKDFTRFIRILRGHYATLVPNEPFEYTA